jgi:hypothetical protein
VVQIQAVEVQEFRQRDGEKQRKPVVAFAGAVKKLIANKTQAFALAAAAGSDDLESWPGHFVTLIPGRTDNGHDTIIVKPAPATPPVG